MREIKFRAWDGEEFWYSDIFLNFSSKSWRETRMSDKSLYPSSNSTPFSLEDLQQFTGLHDKNGVEIYEGDIVKYLTRAVSHLDGIIWHGRVMYQYGAFRLCRNLHNNAHSEGMGYGLPYEYEVIGNIYENSELLQPKHKGE